jgi:hypothetical protein
MNGRSAIGSLLFALLVAAIVGVVSYSAGVSHGLAINGSYRPWGWGWGWGFAPLFFLGFWFLTFAVFRGMFWGGMYGRCGGRGWRMGAFDEWHRRAHEEMNKKS